MPPEVGTLWPARPGSPALQMNGPDIPSLEQPLDNPVGCADGHPHLRGHVSVGHVGVVFDVLQDVELAFGARAQCRANPWAVSGSRLSSPDSTIEL